MTSQTPEGELPHDYHDVWQGELDGTDEVAIKEAQAAPERGVEEADIKIATIIYDGKAYGTSVNEITAQVLEVHHHQLQKAREEAVLKGERRRIIEQIRAEERQKAREEERKQAARIVEEMMEDHEHWKPIVRRILTDHSELDQDKRDDWNEDMEHSHGLAELDQDDAMAKLRQLLMGGAAGSSELDQDVGITSEDKN